MISNVGNSKCLKTPKDHHRAHCATRGRSGHGYSLVNLSHQEINQQSFVQIQSRWPVDKGTLATSMSDQLVNFSFNTTTAVSIKLRGEYMTIATAPPLRVSPIVILLSVISTLRGPGIGSLMSVCHLAPVSTAMITSCVCPQHPAQSVQCCHNVGRAATQTINSLVGLSAFTHTECLTKCTSTQCILQQYSYLCYAWVSYVSLERQELDS